MCNVCRQTPCCPACPNFEDEPLYYCDKCECGIFADEVFYEVCGSILCENCVNDGLRTADRADSGYHSGAPVYSSGDEWED